MFVPTRLVATLLAAGLLGACASDDVGDEVDAAPSVDAEPAARIQVPATDGDLVVDFGINVTGDGSNRIGQLSVLNGRGTIDIFDASIEVAVYEEQPWPEAGYTLYQALAVAEDRWYVAWLYCADKTLDTIYLEGTDGTPLAYESASGTCSMSSASSSIAVQFPAVDMPAPSAVGRFSISGPDIEVSGFDPGVVRLEQTDWILYPFEYVNCTGGCEVGTWYELHAILSDPAAHRAAFGIFYMTVGDPSTVALEYALALPDLGRLGGSTTFTADWTYE